MRRHWGHACLCIIIYIYDLQGIGMSPHPIQSKMDDQYKSFKTLNTPTRLTVPEPGTLFPLVKTNIQLIYKLYIFNEIYNVFSCRYACRHIHWEIILFNLWFIDGEMHHFLHWNGMELMISAYFWINNPIKLLHFQNLKPRIGNHHHPLGLPKPNEPLLPWSLQVPINPGQIDGQE